MSRKYLFVLVVFVLWIVGFYLAMDYTGEDPSRELARLNPLGVVMGLGFYCLAVFTGVFILYLCLRKVDVEPPLRGLSKAWIFGSFIDNILPTLTPLGEATMAYFLEKFYRISYTKSLAAIGMYVSSWGMSVSIFSTLFVAIALYFGRIPESFVIPLVIVIILFSLVTMGWLLLLTKKKWVERIVCGVMGVYNKIYNKIKRRKVTFESCVFLAEFEKSYASLELFMKHKAHMINTLALFIIPQLAHVLCIYSIFLFGFGVEVHLLDVLAIHIVASVAGLLSLIPSGLGVYEAVASLAAANMGVAGITAAATFLIYRLIFVWTTNLLGGVIGMVEGATVGRAVDV